MENEKTYTVTAEQGVGYRGKSGCKVYVARITGSDARYGLSREFIDADRVTRDHFSRAKYHRTYEWDLTEGLYERAAEGDRWYIIIWRHRDGALRITMIDEDRLDAMVRRMDAGDDYETARIATRPAPAAPAVQQ